MTERHTTTTTYLESLRRECPHAWDRFNRISFPVILKMCRDTLENEDEAIELTEAIIRRIGRRLVQFERRKGGRFRNYVWTVAYSRVRDHLRKKGREQKRIDRDLFNKRFQTYEIHRAIADLKASSRISQPSWQMFEMHYFKKLSNLEIAAVFNIKEDSVRRNVARVVAAIEKQLEF